MIELILKMSESPSRKVRNSDAIFRFKQFMVKHDRCGLKVGTDGVVLGALASHVNPKRILDIGTGSGLIALMLAQRYPNAEIIGVEIDERAFLQAQENAQGSPWSERVRIIHSSFQEFSQNNKETFDLIISNPPYYEKHLRTHDEQRNQALQNTSLPFAQLVEGIIQLLDKNGKAWLILPEREMNRITQKLNSKGIFANYVNTLKDKPEKNILRLICGFSFENNIIENQILNIKTKDGVYSKEYSELLKDFLIIF